MFSTGTLSLILLAGLQLFAAEASAEQRFARAQRLYPDARALQSRQTFVGGWALRALQCPSDYTRCEATRGVPTCCPKNTVCVRDGYQNFPVCCQKGEDCLTTVKAVPICADPSWILWKGPAPYSDDPFCCLQGEMGYVTLVSGRFPACGPSDMELEATQRATTLRPATAKAAESQSGGASFSTPTGSSSSSSSSNSGSSKSGSSKSGSSSSSSADANSEDPDTTSKETSEKSSGLSTGVIIGIVVGLIVLVLIVALLIFFIMRMKRKNALLAAQVAAGDNAFAAGGGAAGAHNGKSNTDVTALPFSPPKEHYSPNESLSKPQPPTSPPPPESYYSSTANTELDGRHLHSINPNVPELDSGRRY